MLFSGVTIKRYIPKEWKMQKNGKLVKKISAFPNVNITFCVHSSLGIIHTKPFEWDQRVLRCIMEPISLLSIKPH